MINKEVAVSLRKNRKEVRALPANERGYVLVFSLVMLVVLTILGVWALNTSTVEIMVAGNEQRFEEDFNIAEGAVYVEGGKIFTNRTSSPWYQLKNPSITDQILAPDVNDADFDPGNDIADAIASIDPADASKWPKENLVGNYAANDMVMDYSYLVTYEKTDTALQGFGAASGTTAYYYRMNGNRDSDVEAGGMKVGANSESY